MTVEAALGLGGNLGDPVVGFARALAALEATPGLRLVAHSSVYRTAPWGKRDQPDFLNMAVLVETGLSARALLELCLAIEREGGRERAERWGPRTLDIDILSYGTQHIDEPGLTVPHPHLAARAFVLVPLAEVAPGLAVGGRGVAALRDALPDAGVSLDEAKTARLERLITRA